MAVSSFPQGTVAAAAGEDGVVTVSGEVIIASDSSGPVIARLLINMDGTLDKNEDGTITQIDSGTDWIIPNGSASSVYEVRFVNLTGGPLAGVTTLTEDVWSPMNQDHIIGVARTGADGNGQTIATFDLEIRKGSSGGALDSGAYTLEAELVP